MKIFKSSQVAGIDAYTITQEPILSINLMERAAQACTDWIAKKYDIKHKFVVFVGIGNNGGDGLAIARQLAVCGYSVEVYVLKLVDELVNDPLINYKWLIQIPEVKVHDLHAYDELPKLKDDAIIIDALFGSGLTRPVTGFAADIISFINDSKLSVISIDIPSGLFGEDNSTLYSNKEAKIVEANITLTLQQPNLSFFLSDNERYIGEWYIIPIGLHSGAIEESTTSWFYLDSEYIKTIYKKRKKFSHKGTYGHGLLFAGSYGMMGAAVLTAKAAIKSGIGLLTAHVPRLGVEILQTALPESLVSIDQSDILVSEHPALSKYNAVAFGPGVGQKQNTYKCLHSVLKDVNYPLVIDADGLNLFSVHPEILDEIHPKTILTPHPKEFDRMFGDSKNAYARLQKQVEMAEKYNVYIVLKGAHSSVACPDGRVFFNSSGNPGMATGGSGDVLTGIILSLLAQGYEPEGACKLGVYIHGLAGDFAAELESLEAVSASDIINCLGKAFTNILES